MTEEEKKAIKKIDIIAKECELYFEKLGYECNLYDGDEPIPVKEYRTLLNLIEKQQKEINNLKNKNKELLRKLKNRVKEVKKLIKYSLYKKEFSRLNKQLNDLKEKLENSISKEAIREEIEDIEDYFYRLNVPDEDIEFIREKRKEILGE